MRYHGISKLYVKACIDACGCQKVEKALPLDMSHQKIKVNEQTNCSLNDKFVVEEPMLKVVLDEIQIKYSTCLEKYRTRGKYFQRYICHRGGEPRRFSKCIYRCKY